MIVVNCLQGSAEWEQCRLGIPTASEFSRIVTPTGKLSTARDGYMAELLAEWALGYSAVPFLGTRATERGHQVEPEAIAYYEMLTDTETTRVGFIYRDEDRLVGCSPDFMAGDAPGEIKSPELPGIHLLRLIRGTLPKDYFAQCQGQIWVTGAERCEFLDYYPTLPPLRVTVEPDEGYQRALDAHIPTFIDELLAGRDRLREMGIRSPLEGT